MIPPVQAGMVPAALPAVSAPRGVRLLPSFAASVPGKLAPADLEAMRTFGAKIRDRVGERRADYLAGLKPDGLQPDGLQVGH